MSRPSEKALSIAEELLDYVHPGMNRAAAIEEIAGIVDDMNADLLEVVTALVNEAQKGNSGQYAILLNHLREISANYKPAHKDAEGQHELFASQTETKTAIGVVAGQMP
jgi:hypothetical protein